MASEVLRDEESAGESGSEEPSAEEPSAEDFDGPTEDEPRVLLLLGFREALTTGS